jgi:predicted PurR-regulated permease PerM
MIGTAKGSINQTNKNIKMNARKILPIASLVMLLAIALPAGSTVIVTESSQTNSSAKTETPRAQQLLQRLEDIKDMNKSGLTRLERKSLRKEVQEIKKEMKGGIYLSVGAVIIVILLLILIL